MYVYMGWEPTRYCTYILWYMRVASYSGGEITCVHPYMYVHIVYRIGVSIHMSREEARYRERTRAPRGCSSREVQWWPVGGESGEFGSVDRGRACCDDDLDAYMHTDGHLYISTILVVSMHNCMFDVCMYASPYISISSAIISPSHPPPYHLHRLPSHPNSPQNSILRHAPHPQGDHNPPASR